MSSGIPAEAGVPSPAGVPVVAGAQPTAETGSIYDIGYRKYDGPRLGRAHAIRSLFSQSLRSSFGIGRGSRAKVAPITLGFIVCIPAVAIIAAQALLRQFPGGGALQGQLPIRYDTYASTIGIFVILFCAAQAPDLFGRDQRHSLLALYFSRALRREDYVLARIAGFVVAVFILQLVPQALLFLGQALLATDVVKGMADDLPRMAAVVAQAVLTAGLLGGLAMAISAFTPRRAYAVAGIIALFIIPNIVASIVVGLGSAEIGSWLVLLSPTSVLDGTNAILFDTARSSQFQDSIVFIPDIAYVVAAAVGIVGSIAIAIRRFQGISA
jgi:ABC-2 type transport system permease protein